MDHVVGEGRALRTAWLLMAVCWAVSGCRTGDAVRSPIDQVVTVQNRLPLGAPKPQFAEAVGDPALERLSDLPAHSAMMMRSLATGPASHCPMGDPVPRPGLDFGPTETVARAGYSLLHSADLKTPYWVCETYTAQSLRSVYDRGNLKFSADPTLQLAHAVPADYKGSSKYRTRRGRDFPIHIGHMAPAAAHASTAQRMIDTFYLSNAVPQHAAVNGGQWARLEACARTTGPVSGPKWVISGPMIYTEADVREITVDVIGNGVVIPTHTWKIVVYRSPDGQLKAWAAVMPNGQLPEGSQLQNFVASIDEIEDATGFNFLPELEASEQRVLERTRYPVACQ